MALPDNPARQAVLVPLFGTPSAPVWNQRRSSTTAGAVMTYFSVGAATPYGVNHPGEANADRVFRFTGDGSTVAFTLPTAATGVTYPTTADASLTAANYLQAIAIVYGQFFQMSSPTVYIRRGTDISVGAGEFKINGTTVTFGVAPATGLVIEILIPRTAGLTNGITQINGGAMVASQFITFKGFDFVTTGVAAVSILPTVGSR